MSYQSLEDSITKHSICSSPKSCRTKSSKMISKIVILACWLSAAFAYPMENPEEFIQVFEEEPSYTPLQYNAEPQRVRRQAPVTPFPIQLSGGGGGSPKQGYDVSVDARAPVWTSDNGRHSIDAMGGYSQHLGGPYGNSRPDYRVGGGYTFRF